VKWLRVALAIVAALLLQMTLAPILVRGSLGVDLGLVAVAYLGLTSGPAIGLLSGTVTGLAQDGLAGDIIGISGLGKTIAGFLAGLVGTLFIVARPLPRFVVFFVATLIDTGMFAGLHAVFDARFSGPGLALMSMRAMGNALVGVALFQVIAVVPRLVERRRVNRSRPRSGRP
jgi:rod shape-determining protein MreD